MTYLLKGTLSATTYPGTNPGDTFTLTITTDGFGGVCTVANGHLLSITGTLDGTPYDITLTNGYPASPSFSPPVGLTGQGQLGAGGSFNNSIFTYDPTGFTLADEDNGASGVWASAPCPKNAQGVQGV